MNVEAASQQGGHEKVASRALFCPAGPDPAAPVPVLPGMATRESERGAAHGETEMRSFTAAAAGWFHHPTVEGSGTTSGGGSHSPKLGRPRRVRQL